MCFPTKRSSVDADNFWLDDYEKLELGLRKGSFFVAAGFLCQALERRQNILYETELQNNEMKLNELFDRCSCVFVVLWTHEGWALDVRDTKTKKKKSINQDWTETSQDKREKG